MGVVLNFAEYKKPLSKIKQIESRLKKYASADETLMRYTAYFAHTTFKITLTKIAERYNCSAMHILQIITEIDNERDSVGKNLAITYIERAISAVPLE